MRTRVIGIVLVVVSLTAASPSWAQQHAWVNVPGPVEVLGLEAYDPGVGMIALSDGRVLAAGGWGFDPISQFSAALTKAAIFDGIRSWTMTGSMTTARIQPAMVQLHDGRVMAIGGWSLLYDYACGCVNVYTSVEFYDVHAGTWTPGASAMSIGRAAPLATVLTDGRVLVVGGHNTDPGFNGSINSAEIYDPASDHWTTVAGPNAVFTNYSTVFPYQLAALPDGRAVFVNNDPLATLYTPGGLEMFDPSTRNWTNVTPPESLINAIVAPLADGRLLAAGGQHQNPPYDYLTAAHIYDPVSHTWSDAAPMPRLRSNDVAVRLPDGKVLVGGGWGLQLATDPSSGNTYFAYVDDSRTALYDPASNTWTDGPVSRLADGTTFTWVAGEMVAESTGRLFFSNLREQYAVASGAVYRIMTPPTAVAPHQTAAGLNGVVGAYTVDASASFDADGDPLTQFTWTEAGATLASGTSPATLLLLGVGTHNLMLTVTDSTGQSGTSPVSITVQDAVAALQTSLLAATKAIESDQATIAALRGQVTTVQGQVTTLQGQVRQLQALVGGVQAQINVVQQYFRLTFGDPTFVIPGATVAEQVQSLATALAGVSNGQAKAVYKALGGKK
jgi:hypothetical protein